MKLFKNIMRQILFFLFVTLLSSSAFCQQNKLDNNINIDGTKTTMFCRDEFNLVAITSSKDSIHKLLFTSSQGRLQNLDSGMTNGLFYLSDLEIGKVTIKVFKQVDTGLLLRNYKTYNVIKRPLTVNEKKIAGLKIKPIISLGEYSSGIVPLTFAKSMTKFTINSPYKLKRLVAYFGSSTSFQNPIVATLNSEIFDEHFLVIWKRITVGTLINLENIEVADNKGNIFKLSPVNFSIVK